MPEESKHPLISYSSKNDFFLIGTANINHFFIIATIVNNFFNPLSYLHFWVDSKNDY